MNRERIYLHSLTCLFAHFLFPSAFSCKIKWSSHARFLVFFLNNYALLINDETKVSCNEQPVNRFHSPNKISEKRYENEQKEIVLVSFLDSKQKKFKIQKEAMFSNITKNRYLFLFFYLNASLLYACLNVHICINT